MRQHNGTVNKNFKTFCQYTAGLHIIRRILSVKFYDVNSDGKRKLYIFRRNSAGLSDSRQQCSLLFPDSITLNLCFKQTCPRSFQLPFRVFVHHFFKCGIQFLLFDGLQQIINNATADGGLCIIELAVAADYNHLQIGKQLLCFGNQLKPVHARHAYIGYKEIGTGAFYKFQTAYTIGGSPCERKTQTLPVNKRANQVAYFFFIIKNDQLHNVVIIKPKSGKSKKIYRSDTVHRRKYLFIHDIDFNLHFAALLRQFRS